MDNLPLKPAIRIETVQIKWRNNPGLARRAWLYGFAAGFLACGVTIGVLYALIF